MWFFFSKTSKIIALACIIHLHLLYNVVVSCIPLIQSVPVSKSNETL